MKRRSGIVLLLALLVIVALELTAAALHFTAMQQVRVARAGSRALQLRLGAQSAAADAVQSWPAAAALDMPIGTSLQITAASRDDRTWDIRASAVVERLTDSLFLIRGEARSPLAETARVGVMVLAADALAGEPAAALRTGAGVSLQTGALLAASTPSCDSAGSALELPDPGLLSAGPGARIEGAVLARPELRLTPSLEALMPAAVLQALPHAIQLANPTITPTPVVNGTECVQALPSNWGEPTRPVRTPCSSWFPLMLREGDLNMAGGRGQGILYVAGDLVLSGRASFSGLVLVGGKLSLADGAVLTGMAISVGQVRISDGAIVGDRCALRAALTGARGLSGPYAPPGRRWVPLF